MEITEVRIKLMEDNSGSNERLQAFCSITFDDMFVIRDLKIIEGTKGFFVAMPSRKLSDRCGHCGTKNHLRSRFCNQCGSRLDEARAIRDAEGRAKLHADIAHPINSSCREMLQAAVLATYADELERSKLPGYVSRYDDFDDGDWDNAMPIPGTYANYPGQQAQNNPYGSAPFRGSNQAGPPLRRGPLRPHTQHNQPYAPAYRGPHAPRRHPEGEHVIHQENEGYNSHPSDGYGGR